MKYVKMLGLAAVAAMALTAFLGAGSASATVLCETTGTPCSSVYLGSLALSLDRSLTTKSTGGEIEETYTESTTSGEMPNVGASSTVTFSHEGDFS